MTEHASRSSGFFENSGKEKKNFPVKKEELLISVRFLVPFEGRINFVQQFKFIPGETVTEFFARMNRFSGWDEVAGHLWGYYAVTLNERLLSRDSAGKSVLTAGDKLLIFAALIGG